MENEKQLIFVDEDGNEVLCNILFTFDSEEFNKSYVLFTPVTSEEEEQIDVAAASYVQGEDGTVGELFAIESDEEWQMIEDVLASFDEDECCCDECGEDCDCDNDCEDEDCHHGCCCHHHE